MSNEELHECEAPGCEEVFEKNVWNQKYHSQECKRDVENIRRRREMISDIAAAIAPSYGFEDDVDPDQVEYLRRENRRLTNLTNKYKYKKDELVQGAYQAVHDALLKMEIKPVSPPKLSNKGGDEEIANPALADWQIGKRTPSYNSEVCRDRIELFGDKVIRITGIQRSDHPVNTAHVHALGDMVEGEDIFPGQSFELDTSLYQQIINGVEITVDFLRRMLSTFEKVHFVGVIGNHGLLSSKRRGDYNPETNMDRLMYKFVSMMFADEKRISFNIPDGAGESHFYAVDQMGNYRVLLLHGDQLSQPSTSPTYFKKILGWKDTGIPEDFDDVIMGHWHQNTKLTLGTTVLRIAGTPESTNTYAQERLGVMGRSSQHLQFVHPRRGVSAEYDIYLDEV